MTPVKLRKLEQQQRQQTKCHHHPIQRPLLAHRPIRERMTLHTMSRKRRRGRARYAQQKDAPIKSRKEEYALGMVPRSSSAAMKDVPVTPSKEEYVGDMVQRHIVTTKVVPTKLSKEEYAGDMVQRKRLAAMRDVLTR